MPPASSRPIEFHDLLCNMAGNAYSLFHFGPWSLAMMATYGRFFSDGKAGVVVPGSPPNADSDATLELGSPGGGE